jgi:hypothetical protein
MQRLPPAIVVCAVLLAGCVRQKQLTFAVRADIRQLGVQTAVLTADGKEVARFAGESTQTIDVPGRPMDRYSMEMMPEFHIKAFLPCGWRSQRVYPYAFGLDDAKLEEAGRKGDKVSLGLMWTGLDDPKFAQIIVDNADHASVRVAVGQDERTVPQGAMQELVYVFDDCSQGRKVYLDGKEIGTLPDDTMPVRRGGIVSAEEADRRGNVFLIDPAGSRCYRFGERTFGTSSDVAWLGVGFSRELRPGVFQRLVELGHVQNIMEKPPDRVRVSGQEQAYGLGQTRDFLYRIPCAARAGE